MGRGEQGLTIFLILFVFLVLNFMHLTTEARPLDNSRSRNHHLLRETGGFIGAVKNPGPSPGNGHRFKSLHSLGETKYSGPSPGIGHKFVTGNKN